MKRPIYLDYQSTTPPDPRVVEAMFRAYRYGYGNPHSSHHWHGKEAADAVERARAQIAALIGAKPTEIVFTSGATEANNLAFEGIASWLANQGRTHVITCVTEHKCVLQAAERLAIKHGFRKVSVLPVQPDGTLSLEQLEREIQPDTGLVSIMAANNEIGTLHPLADIARICERHGVLFHTDAAQAAGKIDFDVSTLGLSFASLSSHKIYGPSGIGALYVNRAYRGKLSPMVVGGGQERGTRSGTLPTQLCIGFGEACAIAAQEQAVESQRLKGLRERFLDNLHSLKEVLINGSLDQRLPGNLNLSFAGIDAEALLMKVRDDLSLSSGSACSAELLEPSYVIQALGFGQDRAESAIRIGIGRFTTKEEIDEACEILISAVHDMRPLYRNYAGC